MTLKDLKKDISKTIRDLKRKSIYVEHSETVLDCYEWFLRQLNELTNIEMKKTDFSDVAKRIQKMSSDEVIESLKDAGIIDENKQLTEQYRRGLRSK